LNKKCLLNCAVSALLLAVIINTVSASNAPTPDETLKTRVNLPIIMYHEVKNYNLGKDVISPYDFESDLKYLQKQHYTTITMHALINYVTTGSALPENPIILSFDDGYLSTYKYVLPLLQKYNMKIVLSLIVKNTDDFTWAPDSNIDYSHITWTQLKEMLATGFVEVQNHTYNLHVIKNGRYGCEQKKGEPLTQYEALLTSDILTAQDKIIMMTGKTPSTFVYPYGKYSDTTDLILKKLGFQATLSCRYGINTLSKTNPDVLFRLKRLCRAHSQSVGQLLNEAYKTIKSKPPAVQRPYDYQK
jgi:peptidoglycan/xylan/chitin deacetylase (PgdA/CDA1 family)